MDKASVHGAPPPPDAQQVNQVEEAMRAHGLRSGDMIYRLLAIVGSGVGAPVVVGQCRVPLLLDFMAMRPPLFKGDTSDPLVAEGWLEQIEMIFDGLGVTADTQRVSFATHILYGDAQYWWRTHQTTAAVLQMYVQFHDAFL